MEGSALTRFQSFSKRVSVSQSHYPLSNIRYLNPERIDTMVTREDIENIALLSKLFVDEKDLDSLTEEMQKIVSFADTINNVEVTTGEFDNINNLSNAFRADEVRPSLPSQEILKNAPEQAEDHFLVRKRA